MALTHVRHDLWLAISCFFLVALWANLHGAFPLGVVLPTLMLLATCFDRRSRSRSVRLRRLIFACVASAVGCFVRPFPADTIGYIFNVSTRSVERGLEEWLPTSLQTASGVMFFASVLFALLLLSGSRRRASLSEQLLLAAFFVLAVTSQRMILWWGLTLPLAMARPAADVWRRISRSSFCRRRITAGPPSSADRLMGGAVASVGVLFLCLCTPWTRHMNPLLPPIKRCVNPYDEPSSLAAQCTAGTRPVRTFAPLPLGLVPQLVFARTVEVILGLQS